MGFDGFEDYDYVKQMVASTEEGVEDSEYNGHFSFYDVIKAGQLVDTESHTGRYSALVTKATPLLLKNYVEECIVEPVDKVCTTLTVEAVGVDKCLPQRSINVTIPSSSVNYVYRFSYFAEQNACWFGDPIYKVSKNGSEISNSSSGIITQSGNYTFTITFPNGLPQGYNGPDSVHFGNITNALANSNISASLDVYEEGADTDFSIPYPFKCFSSETQSGIAPTNSTYDCGTDAIVEGPEPESTDPEYSGSGYSASICSSFRPKTEAGNKYIVSAWVKDIKAFPEKTSNSYLKVYFQEEEPPALAPGEVGSIGPQNQYTFKPKGKVIDGWQLITGIVVIPSTEESIQFNIKLAVNEELGGEVFGEPNLDHTESYFDDVRVVPFNGNMKSFVYDEVTQRLMAELDENNYATFYEYDIEGGLVRVKKETEQGVFTIQETRSGNTKQIN